MEDSKNAGLVVDWDDDFGDPHIDDWEDEFAGDDEFTDDELGIDEEDRDLWR